MISTGLITSAQAQTVYEGFDYNTGALSGANGGTGFAGAWATTTSGNPNFAIETPGLSFSTLPVIGNAAGRSSNANRSQANRTLSAASQSALTADNTTAWFSVLWEPGASGTSERGAFMFGNSAFGHGSGDPKTGADGFGFTPFTGSRTTTIHATGWEAGDASDNPSVAVDTGISQATNTTEFLVGKINWKPSGTPDEFFLFDIADPSAGEPLESSAVASITTLDFLQSDWDSIALFENHASAFDEIRLATNFEEVVGREAPVTAVPEPQAIAIWALIGAGFAVFCFVRHRQTRRLT